jgi:hypothetical protein
MFDVERDGWKAETQILLSKVKAGGSSGSGQIWVGRADEQEQQQPKAKQSQAGPSHKKESGFEQLDTVGPEDYNKLLKQWMVRRRTASAGFPRGRADFVSPCRLAGPPSRAPQKHRREDGDDVQGAPGLPRRQRREGND